MSEIVRINKLAAALVDGLVARDVATSRTSTKHDPGKPSDAVTAVAYDVLEGLGWRRTMRFAYRPVSSDSRSPSVWMAGNCAVFIENGGTIEPFFAEDFRDYREPHNEAAEIESLIALGVPSRGR